MPNVGDHGVPGISKSLFGNFRLSILRKSDSIVAMSESSLNELISAGYPLKRILRTPNGIAINKDLIIKQASVAEKCNVVFVGRLTEQKGIDVIISAWVIVKSKSKTPCFLHIFGSGHLISKLKSRVYSENLQNSVIFEGDVQNVRDQLRNMDIFVNSSISEGNSNAILEAMDAGLPVIATPVGGTPIQLGRVGANLIFNVGDHLQLANLILKLISNDAYRKFIGCYLQNRVKDCFDIDIIAKNYIDCYLELIKGTNDVSRIGGFPIVN